MMAQAMLRRMGCTVELAVDGAAAVQRCRQQAYDLVIMDCDMPVMDGYDASRRIRAQSGPNRDVPIVALTAAAFEGDREACLAAGMNDYLAKPIRMRELERTVHRWLKAPGETNGEAKRGKKGKKGSE